MHAKLLALLIVIISTIGIAPQTTTAPQTTPSIFIQCGKPQFVTVAGFFGVEVFWENTQSVAITAVVYSIVQAGQQAQGAMFGTMQVQPHTCSYALLVFSFNIPPLPDGAYNLYAFPVNIQTNRVLSSTLIWPFCVSEGHYAPASGLCISTR